jgi:protocatechuate 3,4-dioxygenase beta subunit
MESMDDDDVLIGRLLSRRDAMQLLAFGGAAALGGWRLVAAEQSSAGSAGPCVVRPELTEGPYFVDGTLARSDVRANTSTGALREGVPLGLTFGVSQLSAGGCAPLPGAIVHIWQCDAAGVYSGVSDPRAASGNTQDNALRGIQTSDGQGRVKFTTLYPGWYRGRAVHIHFKVRTQASGAAYEYTSQLFFPEALNDEIHARPPYAVNGRRDTLNQRDGIYRQGGDQLLLAPSKSAAGYGATMEIALDLSDASVGRSDTEGRGRGRGRGRGGPGWTR